MKLRFLLLPFLLSLSGLLSPQALATEKVNILPPSAWSTEELTQSANYATDEAIIAELAVYWQRKMRNGANKDYGKFLDSINEETPWYDEAAHWTQYWVKRWKAGKSYGILASRLEEDTEWEDLFDNPAWVELVAASARAAEGDAMRDSLRLLVELLPKMKEGENKKKLEEALKQGMQTLEGNAKERKLGAAARYYGLVSSKDTEAKKEAERLLEQAAEEDDIPAVREMALLHLIPGTPSKWYARAAELGDMQTIRPELDVKREKDSPLRREALERGDWEELMRSAKDLLLAGSDNTDELQRAEEYLQRAASQGIAGALLWLARLYEGEFGGIPSPEKACAVVRSMVAMHYAPGYLKMAKYREKGYGDCGKDEKEAYRLLRRAAQSRMPEAIVEWTRMLLRGMDPYVQPTQAAEILLAVHKNDPDTPNLNFYLGYVYESGIGVKKDLGKALKFYSAGVIDGDARAMNNLATMYEEGIGVATDRKRALELYALSAKLGNEDGIANYARLSGKQ